MRSATDAAAFGGDHFVVDLDEERADEVDHGVLVGEDPDEIGASFELRFKRSIGLFDQIFDQCAAGNPV